MGGLFGGGGGGAQKLAGVDIQTSLLGEALLIGWGRARISCNLIDYVAFKAKAQKQGGKGASYTSYTYSASVILALCEGPIGGVRTVYKDSSVFTGSGAMAQAGLSLATGTLTQAPWGYMTSLFPDRALGYSTIAYAYAQDYALGSAASLSNHGFEVDFTIQFGDDGDAVPADVATDFLTNASYGVTGWKSGLIGDWSDWSDYTKATNLLVSPVLDSSSSGADFLKRLTDASNSEFFWSEGVLKCKPYGDATVTGNGVTWTPDLTPVYDLTEDDFLEEVRQEIVNQDDAKNRVQLEYRDRANQYQPAIATAQDLDDIITYGLRKGDVETMHDICDADIAQQVVQLRLQKILYIRDRYVFTLPEDFVLIEPMDYLSLTTEVDGLKLDRLLVLVEEINEDETGDLEMVATAVPGQTASAARYASHSSAGFQPDVDVAPGSVTNPQLFIPPAGLLGLDGEAWIAAASTSDTWGGCQVWVSADGTSYQQAGTITLPARYGVLTAALPAHADPDNDNILSVDLGDSLGELVSATAAEMDAGATLSLIGGELISFQDATLTAANEYDLAPLRRALYETASAAHAIGDPFVRLDDAIFKFGYKSLNVGNTIYVKLPSFNIYGRALEDIATCTEYTIELGALPDLSGTIIAPESINTEQIAPGAVTQSAQAAQVAPLSGTAAFDLVASSTIFMPRAGEIDITGSALQAYSSTVKDWGLQIKVNGTVVKQFPYGAGRSGYTDIVSINASGVALAAGTHVVRLEWAGEDSDITLDEGQLDILIRYV
ncbi:MAG TPA: phage tail protein [Novosphingobium sp.]|nr:phage tail protein [Novosphingobium sp.]